MILSPAFVVLAASLAMGAQAQGTCPFLPQYQVMERRIASAAADVALRALYAYAGEPDTENRAACEAIELERRIGARERMLVALVAAGAPDLHADAAFHCDASDLTTRQCDGIVADGTAQPDALRVRTDVPVRRRSPVRLESRIPGARLIGLYRTSLADIVAGRPVVRIDAARSISLRSGRGGLVLIALFRAPKPYKVRKLVWYF